MEDLSETSEYIVTREQLVLHYAEPLAAIWQRVKDHDQHRLLFNGLQRFLFEDRVAIETEKSRTQVRNECKERTYLVMQRSDAWGRLLSDCFPGALRLSIHPQIHTLKRSESGWVKRATSGLHRGMELPLNAAAIFD